MVGQTRPACQNGNGNGPGVRQLLLYGRHPFTHRHRPCRADDAGIGTYRGSGLLRPGGTFVLNEGNPSSDNGSVIYITSDGRLISYAYWRMNGTELGNAAQDLFIADDKLYIVSQNGGNDGMLVEADARSSNARTISARTIARRSLVPSHVAVVGRTAYIRDNAGVWTSTSIRGASNR